MIDINRVLMLASRAMCEGRFHEADRELNAALLTCSDNDDSDLLLQQLVHLHSHPQNNNLAKAQMYMDRRETDQPSAHVALSQSYFQLYAQANFSAAQHWAEVAIQRAEMEKEWGILFRRMPFVVSRQKMLAIEQQLSVFWMLSSP